MKPWLLHRFFLMLVLLALLCGTSWAGEESPPPTDEDAETFKLGEVVVEGEAETVTQVATVNTVTRKQMELNTADNVADAVNTVPGVTLSVGRRNERTFSIRGFNQRYIPVFYDGIPIYVPYDGYIDTGKIPTGSISKISISKGISSVLYGFNTMGGVVNIISRKPTERFEGDFETGYSEDDAWHSNLNLGSRAGKFYFMAYGGYFDSAGYPLSHHYQPQLNEDGGRRNNSDIDDQVSGSCKIGFIPAPGHEFAIGVHHVDEESGVPPEDNNPAARFWRFTEWKKTTYYFIGDSQLTDALQLQTRFYRDYYDNILDSYDNDYYILQTQQYAFHSTYDDHTTGGSLVLRSTHIKNNTLSLAGHAKYDVHEEQDDYYADWERYESRTFSYGVEDDMKLSDRLSLLFGLSYDFMSPRYANGGKVPHDKTSVNPQAGASLLLFKDTGLHLAVGRKTRFPTLKEQYSGLLDANIPNPNLKEERAYNYEAGIEQPLSWHSLLRCSLFYSDIKNLIVSRPYGPGSNQNQFVNIGKATLSGVELSFNSEYFKHNQIDLNYTYLNARDESSDRTSSHLEYLPEHNLYLSDLYTIHDWVSIFAKLAYNSSRYFQNRMNLNRWQTLDEFWTVDMKVIGTITNRLSLEVGARNIFDENYQLNAGFPMEGRAFFTVLRMQLS
jgi:iron complex outermembrane receptor protein